jgi:hypothetical protein
MICHKSEPGENLRDNLRGSRIARCDDRFSKGVRGAVTSGLPQTPAWVQLLARVPGVGAGRDASADSLRSVWIAFHLHKRRSELQL